MSRPKPLSSLAGTLTQPAKISAIVTFLEAIWDYPPDAYTFLSVRGAGWRDYPIRGDRAERVREILSENPPGNNDIYFCPNAFSEPSRVKEHALPTRYAWVDIDEDDPEAFEPRPNILTETSPGRHQGIWIWKRQAEGSTAEQYSRNLWERYGGDSGGWSITKVLRVPGTINHKVEYARPVVQLLRFDPRPQRMPLGLAFVRLSNVRSPRSEVDPTAHDPAQVIARYRRKVGLEVRQLITATRVLRRDRSKRVFQIVSALILAKATDDEIASILWVKPYFTDKWGQDPNALEREIGRIRARAEADQ